jgi:acrylyl-CoA reductase (NADPH)
MMNQNFDALQLTKTESDEVECAISSMTTDNLMEGDVTIAVKYSTVIYKDGLAVTGSSAVVRKWPMIPGIDFAGTVVASDSNTFSVGDKVLLNGFGVGEAHFGGYSQIARVKSEWLLAQPKEFTARETMAIGTAGYTAMLCVMALEDGGITPDQGEILVTGAAGGVGSVAIALLSSLGYTVIASTGRTEEEAYLKYLGANSIIDRAELSEKGRPLGKERFAGAIDSVGSFTLANVLAQTKYAGTVAACGLAQGADLPTTVMPFILRGVTLAGIDSVMASLEKRKRAWQRLATDLDRDKLESMIAGEIALGDVPKAARDILDNKIRGRLLVKIGENG